MAPAPLRRRPRGRRSRSAWPTTWVAAVTSRSTTPPQPASTRPRPSSAWRPRRPPPSAARTRLPARSACSSSWTPATRTSWPWASPTPSRSARSPRTTPTSTSPSWTTPRSDSAGPNVDQITFAENEGSFLVGAAAALKSKAGHIGFVGGVNTPLIKKFEAGYIAGAKAVNPNIKIRLKYLTQPPDFSGFGDPAKGKTAAEGMFQGGADVVYHAAGGSGGGVFTAAKAAGKMAIGVDSDQALTAAADVKDVIITSMIKKVDVGVFDFIKSAGRRQRQVRATRSTTSSPAVSTTRPPAARSTTSRPSSTTTSSRSSTARSRSPRPRDLVR